jgi:quercetin dioxygenase-like cupin family protein
MVANSLTGTVTLFKMDPGNVGALHSHPHAQYGMCLEGSGTFTIGGTEFKVKKGDGWYIPPGIQHGLRVDSSQSATVIDFFTPHREDFSKEVLPSDQK